jgi:hypothetical protein
MEGDIERYKKNYRMGIASSMSTIGLDAVKDMITYDTVYDRRHRKCDCVRLSGQNTAAFRPESIRPNKIVCADIFHMYDLKRHHMNAHAQWSDLSSYPAQ